MKKFKNTYIILWSLFFVISLLLVFTLPSIWVYYDGFSEATLQSIGVSNEAINTLTKGLNIVDGVLPKNLGINGLAKVALSYVTAYVPADFPANNLPVKFWGAVILLVFSFGYNLWTVLQTLDKTTTNDDAFFNIPIILQSLICLAVSVIVSLYMVINDKVYYIMAIIIYVLLIIITLIIYHGTDLLKSYIKGIDDENKIKKRFINELKTGCELLINKGKNDESISKIKVLLEDIKYSPTISNERTENIELKILKTLSDIKQKIESDNNIDVTSDIDNLISELKERNILAKN